MTDDANLHGTLDASVWAAEFCKRWPSALCQIAGKEGVSDGPDFEATMIGWFANAIMTGYDKALAASPEVQALIREAEARGVERGRADAKAAVAVVVERAAERLDLAEHDAEERDWRSGANAFAALAKSVRALAPEDAIAEVARLREELARVNEVSGFLDMANRGLNDQLSEECGRREKARAERDRAIEAVRQMHHAVCGETGFAAAVRADSGRAYPWPALDLAEEIALEVMRKDMGNV